MISLPARQVSPYEVEDAILSHSSVKEVAAFAHPHTLLGEVVACAFVPTEGVTLSLDDLVSHIRGRLAEHKLPHKAIAVASIPKGPTGKVQRTFLMQQLGLATPAAASAQSLGETAGAPQPLSSVDHTSKVEAVVVQLLEALKHVWADVVQRDDPPNLHDDFVARGGNSLAAAIFAARVTKQLHKLALLASGRSLSAVSVMSLRTPHRLAQHILATGGDAAYENHSNIKGGDSLQSKKSTFALGSNTPEALTVFQQQMVTYRTSSFTLIRPHSMGPFRSSSWALASPMRHGRLCTHWSAAIRFCAQCTTSMGCNICR